MRTSYQAHRGLTDHEDIPENVEPAFYRAAEAGLYDSIEVDVRWDADGKPHLFHDEDLWKTNGSGLLRQKPSEEVEKLKLDYNGIEYKDGITSFYEGIKTLEEIIKDDKFSIDELTLEVKEPCSHYDEEPEDYMDRYRELMDEVERRNLKDQTMIHSFNPGILEIFADEGYSVSLAYEHASTEVFDTVEDIDADIDIVWLPYHRGAGEEHVREGKERGIDIGAWGIKSGEDLARAGEIGFERIGVDLPEHIEYAKENLVAEVD